MQLKQGNSNKMTIKITQEKQNPLFKRKEIEGELEAVSTPSKADVLKLVAEQTKSKEETIVIKNILSSFGSQTFKIKIFIYDSKESLEASEGKQAEPEAPKEEAPAQEAAPAAEEAKPAETETPKEETKPEEAKNE